jgi:hypothetical protein
MMMKTLFFVLFCATGLAACDQTSKPVDQAAQQELVQLQKDYTTAAAEDNWLLALQNADVLIAKFPQSEEARKLQPQLADIRKKAETMQEEKRLASLWDYQQNPVGKKTQYSAGIYSEVPLFAGQPSDLPPAARLIVRIHPEWGKSIYLVIAQDSFSCGSPCTMQIRFDDKPAKTFPGKQASTGTGPALFIENDKAFYKAMQSANIIKIKLNKLSEMEFKVASYDAKRLGAEF